MIKRLLFIIILFTLAGFSHELMAVGMGMGMGMGPPGDPCGFGPFPPCPSNVPLDGGITLLAGAGIALGARKYLKRK